MGSLLRQKRLGIQNLRAWKKSGSKAAALQKDAGLKEQLYKNPGDVESPLRAAAEEGGADADFGGAFFDGNFEVVRHPHGQN